MMKRQRKFENQKVEECGIWLDTEELKRKRAKAHSISELLNPLSRSKYNIEVSLNFTQTRAPQHCVKQTTVSSFFFPKSKGKPGNISHASNLQAVGTASPFSSTSEEETLANQPELTVDADSCADGLGFNTVVDGREMGPTTLREVCHATVRNDSPPSTTRINTALTSDEQISGIFQQTQHSRHKATTGIDGVTSELQSSTTGETAASIKGLFLPPDDSTQCDFTQDSQGNRVISHRGSSPVSSPLEHEAWPHADSEVPCVESFRAELLDSITSTQRTASRARCLFKRKAVLSPKKLNSDRGKCSFLDDKENIFKPGLSHFMGRRNNLNQSSLKRTPLPFESVSLPQCLSVPHDKPVAFKRWQGLPSNQCELSDLFSQDSQGNRVISHRSMTSRIGVAPFGGSGPLRALCKSPPVVGLEDDNTFSPLFTQDSEGHVVIKHSSKVKN